jgi:hypothetical protein
VQISNLDIIRICISFLLEEALQAQEEIDQTETETAAAAANERKTSLLALLRRMHKNWVGSSGSISEKEIHSKLQLCVNSLQKHRHCTTHTNTLLLCLRSRLL